MPDTRLIKSIEEDLQIQKQDSARKKPGELDSKWDFLVSNEPSRFLNPDLTLKTDVLKNFRKLTIFIPDEPHDDPSLLYPRNIISGGRRGMRRLLLDCFQVLEEQGCLDLLKKYPVNRVGNPNIFRHRGYEFTQRWTKHIYTLNLFKKILEPRLRPDFVALDIGSSYGIFSYLLKKEYPRSHHILLDFPEQLILANYFLGTNFPDAKIATYKELSQVARIDRKFVEQYDFILLPWYEYEKFAPDTTDVVTNFASFGEMRREWFEFYINNEPFRSTRFFLTENRFQSAPTYDSDLTVLDYPLQRFRKLHFAICPMFTYTYTRHNLFFTKKVYFSSQYFEFIGERA